MQRTTTVRGHLTGRTATKKHRKVAIAKATQTTAFDLLLAELKQCKEITFAEIKKLHEKAVSAGNSLMRLVYSVVRRFNSKFAHSVGATCSFHKREQRIRFYAL